MSIADGDNPLNEPITIFILQMVIIVTLSRMLAFFFKYLKQPPVIAEVIAGILLGPSALGRLTPFAKNVFPTTSIPTLTVVADIGLILFMYMVGLELDSRLLKKNAKSSITIAAVALVIPFGIGILISIGLYRDVLQASGATTVPFSSFLLFVAVAFGITAFPVLARILAENRMLEDRVGNLALGAAAVEDVTAWILLAVAVSIANAKSPLSGLWSMLMLIGFVLFMFFALRPLLAFVNKHTTSTGRNTKIKLPVVAFFLIIVFASSWFTEVIGVHFIFGAFATGVITPRKHRFAIHMTERLEDLTLTLLLPLYFTLSGLNTNVGSIKTSAAGGYLILVIVTACIAKIGSGTLAAKIMKNNWRDSCTIGILMNAKGLVELIVLNIGLNAKVLNVELFSMFVIMCIVTTCMTSPLTYFIYLKHKQSQVIPKETHSFLAFVPDQKTATGVLTCVGSFSGSGDTTKVFLLNEISERPSSYFFQFSRKNRSSGAPSLKDKSNDDFLSTVRRHGANQGLSVKAKILTSNEIPLDVVNVAHSHTCNMLLFAVNGDSDREAEENVLTRSLSNFMALGGYLGWHSVSTDALVAVKQRTDSRIGAYIHRGAGLATVHKIILPFTGEQFEKSAFDMVLLAHPSVKVAIYCLNGTAPTINSAETPHVVVQPSENPYEDASVAAKDSLEGFTLVVCGMDRSDSNKAVAMFIDSVTTCMLLIYNPVNERKSVYNTLDVESKPLTPGRKV